MLADLAVAQDLGAKLDALGVPWVVVGSVASSLLGEPRATADVDLVADLRGVHVREFCRSIAEDYYWMRRPRDGLPRRVGRST